MSVHPGTSRPDLRQRLEQGPDPAEVMAGYRSLPGLAGLDELYDIERNTTEPGT